MDANTFLSIDPKYPQQKRGNFLKICRKKYKILKFINFRWHMQKKIKFLIQDVWHDRNKSNTVSNAYNSICIQFIMIRSEIWIFLFWMILCFPTNRSLLSYVSCHNRRFMQKFLSRHTFSLEYKWISQI